MTDQNAQKRWTFCGPTKMGWGGVVQFKPIFITVQNAFSLNPSHWNPSYWNPIFNEQFLFFFEEGGFSTNQFLLSPTSFWSGRLFLPQLQNAQWRTTNIILSSAQSHIRFEMKLVCRFLGLPGGRHQMHKDGMFSLFSRHQPNMYSVGTRVTYGLKLSRINTTSNQKHCNNCECCSASLLIVHTRNLSIFVRQRNF